MRHPIFVSSAIAGIVFLSACAQNNADDTVQRAFQDVNVVDETNLTDIMLTVADPNEAVNFFTRSVKEDPTRVDFQRGLSSSLMRAKRYTEAAASFKKLVTMDGATLDDKVELADALVRSGDWAGAEKTLDSVPPTHETFKRYRLEAIIADGNQEWKKADSFYETAVGLTTRPGSVMNNWGYSKLTRGDFKDAERLFSDAVRQDPTLFTAKNNLILARSAQGNYTLPVIPMDQTERAQLLHTMALSAVKHGDVETGKRLLRDAIQTHPQHFEAAVGSLRALDSGKTSG
jgi:Flp pilus assembly protein TadD